MKTDDHGIRLLILEKILRRKNSQAILFLKILKFQFKIFSNFIETITNVKIVRATQKHSHSPSILNKNFVLSDIVFIFSD